MNHTLSATNHSTGRKPPGWAAPAALAVILLLATGLYGWAIGSLNWGNTYYAAAVKSMSGDWVRFLFGSYDPAGVVTVDKPPAALWPQVISAKIFGMHGWALILPQVIEGVLTVLLLHRTVRRWAGETAGLAAALILALTPITVAINRDNNPDPAMMLLLVAAAYALTRALRDERARTSTLWAALSGLLIGCGFLTKMLAAWMVLPAFTLAFLIGARSRWLVRLGQLAVAAVSVLVSSLWWVALVRFWPGERPYIGGSEDGSAWSLVIGYNGLGRIFGRNRPGGTGSGGAPAAGGARSPGGDRDGFTPPNGGGAGTPGGGPGGGAGGPGGGFSGTPGPLRLFNDQLAVQISWLLPVCLIALLVAITCAILYRRGNTNVGKPLPASGWVLWGTWLVTCAAVFSFQEGPIHPYYTTQLAPAIAALCGGLLATLGRAHRQRAKWVPVVGALGVAVTIGWATILIRRTPEWHGYLAWPVLGIGGLAVAALVTVLVKPRLLPTATAISLIAVLLAPAVWSVVESFDGSSGTGGVNPTAGPASMGGPGRIGPGGGGIRRGGMPAGGEPLAGLDERPGRSPRPGSSETGGPTSSPAGRGGPGGASLSDAQRQILRYVVRNSGSARIDLAVTGGAMSASGFILHSDATVIGMGGFTGSDNAPSVAQLRDWSDSGDLRYVLDRQGGRGGPAGGSSDGPGQARSEWIENNCSRVPPEAYRTGGAESSEATGTLYECTGQ